MDSYVENHIDKRAYIVPVVTLALCIMALTCCAFAYYHSSQAEIEYNELNGNYYEIDYTDSNGVSINDKLDELALSFYTDIVINDGVRTFNAYSNADTIVRDFYVTLNTDMSGDFTISTAVDMGSILPQIVTIDSIVYDADETAVENGDTVKITLTFAVANVDIKTITGITPNGSSINGLSALQTAIADLCSNTYDVSVTALPN